VARRRKDLGLSVDEVASRAGMHPSYLAYVESNSVARPSEATCIRLAGALATTVPWLRGGTVDRPVGAGASAGGIPEVHVLDPDESLRHLDGGGIGRAVFDDDDGPVALPVNYKMVDGALVFRTGDGTIATALRAGHPLSVEVDHLDEVQGEGWSVLVRGTATEVTDPGRLAELADLHIEPWADGDRHTVVVLEPATVTGRRIVRRH
jgi:hypothetical protein